MSSPSSSTANSRSHSIFSEFLLRRNVTAQVRHFSQRFAKRFRVPVGIFLSYNTFFSDFNTVDADPDVNAEERRWREYSEWTAQPRIDDWYDYFQEHDAFRPQIWEDFQGFPGYVNPYKENPQLTEIKREKIEGRLDYFDPFRPKGDLERWKPDLLETYTRPEGRREYPAYSPFYDMFVNYDDTDVKDMSEYRKDNTGRDWEMFLEQFSLWMVFGCVMAGIRGAHKGFNASTLLETRMKREVPLHSKLSMIYGGAYESIGESFQTLWGMWFRGLLVIWFSYSFVWPNDWQFAPYGTAVAYLTYSRMGGGGNRTPTQRFLMFGGSLAGIYMAQLFVKINPESPRDWRYMLGIPYPTEWKIKEPKPNE